MVLSSKKEKKRGKFSLDAPAESRASWEMAAAGFGARQGSGISLGAWCRMVLDQAATEELLRPVGAGKKRGGSR